MPMVVCFALMSLCTQSLCKDRLLCLEGTWSVVSAKAGDEVITDLFDGVVYKFKGAKVSVERGMQIESELKITILNWYGQIDYISPIPGGGTKSVLSSGIYRIGGQKLTVCLAPNEVYFNKDGTLTTAALMRPTRFHPSQGTLVVLERKR